MAAPVIQFKRGQFANLPGLRAGEPGFTTDKYDLYVGIDSTTSNNKFFGSHRYWNKETATTGSEVRVVEGSDNGDNYIALKSPDSLAENVTYTLPGTVTEGGFLTVDSSGNLSWDNTLDAVNVYATGVGTVAYLQSTTVNVSAGATIAGALDVDGGANISGGEAVLSSATVSDLTAGRVVVAGTDGAIEDSGNLTFDGSTLSVSGDVSVTNNLSASQANVSGVVTASTFDGNLATTNLTGTITNAQLAGSISNDKLVNESVSFGGVELNLGQSDATPAFDLQDATNLPTTSLTGTITNDQLAGSIANSKLVNDSVSFGGVEVELGSSDATPAFDLQDATNLPTTALTGTITNDQLAGSIQDSKLNTITTANKVRISAIDIDGGASTTEVSDADLFIVDDGANGTNRKVTAEIMKDYMLGGGQGANFEAINVSGIATVTFADATTLKVAAGATVTGALDVDGGADIAGGATVAGGLVANSAQISDLTSGRVVLAGTSGELEDSGNLTFDGNALSVTGDVTASGDVSANDATLSGDLTVTGDASAADITASGDVTVTGSLDVNGGATLNSAVVEDLTSGRVVLAGTGGELEDSANLTFGANGLNVTGDSKVSGVVTATSFATGAEGSALILNETTITGPSSITIDPAGIGDNTGTVYILGDLQVDGTQTIINSTTVTVNDKNIQVADGAINDAAADGAGFTVNSGDGDKTFQYEATGENFGSSENINLASGKTLKVNNTEVLSGTELSSGIRVDVASVDIDGATATTEVADADLMLIDDGANGTNRKVTAGDLKEYMLGGGAGANFEQINVSGVATVTYADAQQLKVAGITTLTGALDADGGADIAGGLVADTAKVSDLTSGRVVLAGTDGEIEDSANFTFDGETLTTNNISADQASVAGVVTATTFEGNLATTNLTGTITNAQLAGSIENSKLVNDSVSFGGVELELGQTDATPAFDLQDATNLPTTSLTGTITNAQLAGSIENGKLVNDSVTVTAGQGLGGGGEVDLGSSITLNLNVDDDTLEIDSDTAKIKDGGVTNAKLAGSISDTKLNQIATANKVNVSAIDIDGATATTDISDDDLFIVDDGAAGANRKVTAENIKEYMLGGGTGANFEQINVSGLATVTHAKATTLTVGAGATVAGALDVNGSADFSAGINVTGGATLNSASVTDLTEGRVVLAGLNGELEDSGNLTFGDNGLTVSGGANVSAASTFGSDLRVGGDATIVGNLYVEGTTTTINSTVVSVDDKNIELGATASPSDASADGGGITLKGSTDHTFNWSNGSDAWTSSEHMDLVSGKEYRINNTEVLTSDTLGSGVVNSSLTSVGTLHNLTVTNGINGQLNTTGVSTNGQVQATNVNSAGIVTASQFSGSGAGLDYGSVPAMAVNIDGAAAIVGDLAPADLFIVDDGANGTNRKATAQEVKDFVLGGGAGANFEAIEVTGIATAAFVDATTLKVAGVSTFSGALEADAGATLSSAKVSDLTAGRVVLAGTDGELEDNAGLTYDGSQLSVTGSVISTGELESSNARLTGGLDVGAGATVTGFLNVDGGADISGGETVMTSATVADLTATRLTFAGTGGQLQDSDEIKRENNRLVVGGSGVQATEVSVAGIVTAASFDGSGAGLDDGTVPAMALDIDGATESTSMTNTDLFVIDDGASGTNRKITAENVKDYVLGGGAGANFEQINVSGISTVTFADATTLKVSAGATVTGALDVDGGADISGGETTLSSATVSDLTSGRVVLAGTDGAIEDSANLTFDGSTLSVTGDVTASGDFSGANGTLSGDLSVTGDSTLTGEVVLGAGVTVAGAADFNGGVAASSMKVEDLTEGRVVLAGADGELEDKAGLTYTDDRGLRASGDANVTGVVTATTFSTGAEGSSLIIESDTITGPATIFLDPAGIGDNTGRVIIKGDLQVDGTQTIVNSTSVTVDDLNIMLADGAANDAAADGGGFTVTSGEGNKTFQFEATGDNFGSSENINLASGKVLKVNNTEILSASALSSNVVVDVASVDIDGATAIGEDIADADLFLIDNGADGTNRKTTAGEIKDYILGGGAGGTFEQIVVTGIATLNQTSTTDIVVSAGATVTGALDVDGGMDVSGGEAVLASATVSDLSAGRVVLAGTDGALEDNALLTYSASQLVVGGSGVDATEVNVSGVVTASSFIGDLTGDVVGNVTGNLTGNVTGNVYATGISTVESLHSETISTSGIITATNGFRGSDLRDTTGALLPLVGVQSATPTGLVTAFKFVGSGLEDYKVENQVATIRMSGVAASTYTTSQTHVAVQNQTTFTMASGYQEGFIDVYLNGIRLITGTDYTANDDSTVVLGSGVNAGDEVELVSFKELGDLIHVQNLKTTGDLTVSGVATATTFNGQVNTAGVGTFGSVEANRFTGDLTGNVNASGISTLGNFSVGTNGVDAHVNGTFTATDDIRVGSSILLNESTGGFQGTRGNFSGNVTANTFTGDLTGDVSGNLTGAVNATGVSTITQLEVATLSASGIVTATGGFVGDITGDITGSLANATEGTLNVNAIDIDGATAIGAELDANDIFIVDDGANGTNRKVTADEIKTFMLGGGGGANFEHINVSGISTLSYAEATTLNVGAAATFSGTIDANGGADISGGETTMSSATVSDLTDGRVVLAGTNGALEDSASLTFDGTVLTAPQITAGTSATLASAAVSDLTSGRVVLAGTSGELEDSANLTFNGTTLTATGNANVTGNMTVGGNLTVDGTLTSINTNNTTINDVLLELQRSDSGDLTGDTNKDVGLVMNYFDGSAKKAAIYWDDSAGRFVLADEATENAGVMTPTTYGGLEVGSLYLNDCAGSSQVISCSGTTRSLENITIDGGSF